MMAGVGVGVTGTGLGREFSCVRFVGTMVTLGVNASGVSVGTLGDGAG